MYALCNQRKPVSAAAKAVAEEMKLRPRPDQAAERLRKKFSKFREEREKASRSTRPEPQSGNIPPVEIAEQVRQIRQFLRTPEGKALKEKARLVYENKASILEAAARTRRFLKSKI